MIETCVEPSGIIAPGKSARAAAAVLAATLWSAPGAAQEPPRVAPPSEAPSGAPVSADRGPSTGIVLEVPVISEMSLVHVGSSDSFAITTEGRQAATALFEALAALDDKHPAKAQQRAREALTIYTAIIPRENYGGEYTALQWFADYLVANDDTRATMTADPFVGEFFKMFGGNDYAVLKEYLQRKYKLKDIGDEETHAGQMRKAYLEDTILFNNPRRETWEHTSELLRLLNFHPGMTVADVGAGPGYYSFRFAGMVGPQGRVIAIDNVAEHLKYVQQIQKVLGVDNIRTIQTDGKSLGLAGNKVDAVFLCSLYHNVYAMATAPERDAFVAAIKEALTDDGLLYLADNGLVQPGVLPYHGPYIAKELLIGQMLNYGFDLVRQHQHIPQRYLLVFKKRPTGQAPAPVPAPAAAPPAIPTAGSAVGS